MAASLAPELGIRRNTYYYHTHDGFYFHKYKAVGATSYYRCTMGTCPALGIMRFEFELRSGHNHAPCPEYMELMRQRRNLIVEAATMADSDVWHFFDGDRVSTFPDILTYERLRNSIQRERLSNLPEEPPSLPLLNQILSNPSFQSVCATSCGETLYGGSRRGDDGSIAVLIMSRRCSELLNVVTSLYTFSLNLPIRNSPNIFQSIPLAFLLLERGTLPAYICGLSLFRDKLTRRNFTTVVCHDDDFLADAYRLIFAVDIVFPLDHYILKIGKLAKQSLPEDKLLEQPTKGLLNLCCGLPLVPQNLLPQAVNFLQIEFNKPDDELLQHIFALILVNIKLQWIYSPLRGPKFSVCGNRERTSDAVETAKENILYHIPPGGIGLFTFLNRLKRTEEQAYAGIARMNTNLPPRRQCHSLSDDPEIMALTNILVGLGLQGDISASLKNLMAVASAKRHHILLKSLQQ